MDNTNGFSIVSNCPLCEEHSLHVTGEGKMKTQQCINCGFATAEKFKGFKDDTNEAYTALTDEMKEWSKYANGRVWIPSIITLPFGMLYTLTVDNNVTHNKEMKWSWAEMIDIAEEDRKNKVEQMQENIVVGVLILIFVSVAVYAGFLIINITP